MFFDFRYCFSGDILLIRGSGRTDFQSGNASNSWESITQKLFTLDDDTCVYPGHDYNGFSSSTIIEEKQHNPRLGNNRSKSAYVEIMDSMNLVKPKRIDEAVPANIMCGL